MSEKKINIPFSGITRNTDDGICRDGECMELINARIKNGSIEPIPSPIVLQSFNEEYTKGYYHPAPQKYLFITSDTKIVSYDKDLCNKTLLSDTVTGVTDIQFIGYILCAMTDEGIHYFIFKEKHYKYIGQKPEYTISVYATEEKEITIEKEFTMEFTEETMPHKMDYRDVPKFIDFLDACKNEALDPYKNEDRLSEPVCVRAALRMYNGTYIYHSPIYVLFPLGKIDSSGFLEDIEKEYTGGHTIKINWTLKTYRVKCEISFDNISDWRDVVSSVDIFISRPFNIIDFETLKVEGISIGGNVPVIKTYVANVMADKIAQIGTLLYLSKSLTSNFKEIYLKMADISQEQLSEDSFSRNNLSGKALFVYNNRLHIGNVKNILFKGFGGNEILLANGYSKYNGYTYNRRYAQIKMFTYLDTDSGEKTVLYEGTTLNPLQPFICYPDYRAKKALIYAATTKDNGDIIYKKKEISFRRQSNNLSYYLNWGDRESAAPLDLSKDGTTITESEFQNPNIPIDNIEESPNKLKVSDLNNPFYFPAKTTYTPSSGEILALCSNTVAISQGQFGQFPLIVFCKDGIYAMNVGTDIVYTNSAPLSRDVCNNPNSVTPIDHAIVFSSEQGIMLLQGSNIKSISDSINGYLPSCVVSSPIIQKILNIPKLDSSLSSVQFDAYIKNCEIGYNYQERELIVSNKNYSYSYIYSLSSEQWYKTSYSIRSFINGYPDILAIGAKNDIYNLQNNHRTVANIAIITRPIKLGTLTHKRILQSALRGIVKRSISDLYLRGEPVLYRGDTLQLFKDVGFYVLGSNDSEHFALISGTELIKDIRDIVSKMNKSKSYKYFIFAFIGGVRTDVSINYIELIADESFNNRLR